MWRVCDSIVTQTSVLRETFQQISIVNYEIFPCFRRHEKTYARAT